MMGLHDDEDDDDEDDDVVIFQLLVTMTTKMMGLHMSKPRRVTFITNVLRRETSQEEGL